MTCEDVRAHKNLGLGLAAVVRRPLPTVSCRLGLKSVLGAVVALGATAASAETPKRGGILTYMIPADAAEPRWAPRDDLCDGARDGAVLQRADPRQSEQPGLDHGFRVRPVHRDAEADRQRPDLHVQDPQGREVPRRLAAHRAGRRGELEQDRLSAQGRRQRAPEQLRNGRQDRRRRTTRRWCSSSSSPPSRSCRRWPTPTPTSTPRRSSTRTCTGTRRTSWGRAPSSSPTTRSASRSRASATPTTITRVSPISTASSASSRRSSRCAPTPSGPTARRWSSARLPASAKDQLVKELGDKITVQESDWNCGNVVTPNHKHKPFDDVRVRKALFLAVDQWKGAPALSKIAIIKTVGGIVFPGSPLAATKEELQQLIGYWPDIEKSRAEARRLLKEAGQENLTFELLNRNVDQPYKIVGTWLVDEWSKVGIKATQKVVPTGPWFDGMRSGRLRRGAGGQLPERRQPDRRRRPLAAARGLPRELRLLRRSADDRYLQPDAEGDRHGEGARADAPVREAHQR